MTTSKEEKITNIDSLDEFLEHCKRYMPHLEGIIEGKLYGEFLLTFRKIKQLPTKEAAELIYSMIVDVATDSHSRLKVFLEIFDEATVTISRKDVSEKLL